MLPGMNGIEFAEVLKTRYPRCGVELMSGHPATEELTENARRVGRELAVIPKPFNPSQFLAIARGGRAAAYEDEKSIEGLAASLEPQVSAVGAEPLPGIAETELGAIRKPGDPGSQA
jgi:CheY-like chemotaxis protein